MRFVRSLLLAITLMASASTVRASDIAVYDFTGQPGNQASTASTSVAPGYTFDIVQPLSLGLISGPLLSNSINAKIDYTAAADYRYYTFWGYTNDYSAWDFNFVRTGYTVSTGSGTLPTQVNLAYSIDSGSTWADLGTKNLTGPSGDLDFTFSTITVPTLSYFGASFKLTAIGGSGTDTNFALTNGTFGGLKIGVAVPEPSTYALGAIASGVMAFTARRRKLKKAC